MARAIRQAAAIPIRDGMICMVTSRSKLRWVLPKGRIEIRQTASEAALVEAWEEAGLLGTIQGDSVGSYHYEKYNRDHHVLVFVMKVLNERAEWPEFGERERQWVSVEEAIRRIEEPDLKDIVRTIFRDELTQAAAE